MTEFFLAIVNMGISASFIILLVVLLRLVFKKAPRWIFVLLWGIVAVRLICPISIESAFSLIPSAETISPEIMTDATPTIHTGFPAINSTVNPIISESFAPEPGASANPLQILIPILSVVWIVGCATMLIYAAISYIRLRRKVSTAVLLKKNIYESELTASPFVLGLIKPKIYLPIHMDERDIPYVISHEQAHILRKDHWWKPIGYILLAIHWFNPLMWLGYILLCRDIELACDEKVIKGMEKKERADYSQALLASAISHRTIAACPLAFGEVGVKNRVKSVLNYKKPAFWIIVAAIIACAVVAVCFLTNPKQDRFSLRIVIPPGSEEEFVYSHEEICATGNKIIIWSGEGLSDTEVILKSVNDKSETGYVATYLTPGRPVEFDAVKDEWFKVGVNMQNPTDQEIEVFVDVENVEVRISDESSLDKVTFEAEILEIHDRYYLVKPEPTWAINSADRIEVPLRNMYPSPEPLIGDVIEIEYSGEILETYPARIAEVYSIRVVREKETLSLNDVIMLSQQGYDLTWSDFEQFKYIETGSGLYIRVYEINEMFELWIGGGSPDSEPMYIYLALAGNIDTRIDIRDGGVTDFVSEHSAASIEESDRFIKDRTDPSKAAEEFLERYFNDLCTGNTDWGWNNSDYSQYDGLLAYSEHYYNDICIMKQWVNFVSYLADKDDGYNRESSMGRFSSLEVRSFGILDSLSDAEYHLQGYFKTTSFGTFLEMGMKRQNNGEYQIVYVAFPDWKEYNNFAAAFVEYMNAQGIQDYNKSAYIDHLRGRENEIREDWKAWQNAERIAAPYTKMRSEIELSRIAAKLNSNGVYPAEKTQNKKGMVKDIFRTERKDYPAENWVLLEVTQVFGDSMPEGMDFVGYASDMLEHYDSEICSEVEEFDPNTFFGKETPVKSIWRKTLMTEGSLSMQTDSVHDVYTRYYVHCSDGEEEYLLAFDFHNAVDYGVDGQAYDGWRLIQSLDDCEQWMKTLHFPH